MARIQGCLALLLLLLAGCAAPNSPLLTGSRPADHYDPGMPPQAMIIALHGFNDHRKAFAEFGEFAAQHGILVDAYDQQGFGENPNWGFWPGKEALRQDLLTRIGKLQSAYPQTPLFVLGESMGGAVALTALAGPQTPDIAGLILSAPAVWGGDAMNPIYRGVLWLSARIAPNWTVTGSGLKIQASDNIPMLRALGRDPLFIKQTRLQSVEGLVEVMGEAREAGLRLDLPVLLLDGLKDEVVPVEAFDSFAQGLAAEPCRRIRYAEGWHLLLRDLQRRQVWQDILIWLANPRGTTLGQPCSG